MPVLTPCTGLMALHNMAPALLSSLFSKFSSLPGLYSVAALFSQTTATSETNDLQISVI